MRPKNNNYHQQHEYDHYTVGKPAPLLEWLLANIKGESKTKIKQTLQGVASRWMARLSPSSTMPCVLA